MESDTKKKAHLIMAQKRVERIRDFYSHLIIYCTVNVLFFAFWFFLEETMPKTFWKPSFIIMIGVAGLVVAAHGLLVFAGKYVMPKGWEEKKFKELMDKKKKSDRYE